MFTRRRFLRGLLGAVLAGVLATLWGFLVEPAVRLRVRRWRIARPSWTAPPLRIALISDLHLGAPYVGLGRLRQVVRRCNALEPDLILLLGDYAAGHRFVTQEIKIAEAAPLLAELTARHGTYAVLGNHDWWDDRAAQQRGGGPNLYAETLKAHGIPVLSNDAMWLNRAGIWLAGVESQLALLRGAQGIKGLDDLPAVLAQITGDAPVVLMAHEPDIFARMPARVALTVSGHTHGGQVRLFGWSPVVPSRYGNRFAYGHISEDGKDLVVSGGVGCSILPVRFGMTPEITVVEIGTR